MNFAVKAPRENVVGFVLLLGIAALTAVVLALDLRHRPVGPSRVAWPSAGKP